MTEQELIAKLCERVKADVQSFLNEVELGEISSVDAMEARARRLTSALLAAFFQAWTEVLERAAKALALRCPGCGQARKCKRRLDQPMQVRLLGIDIAVPKLYLQCECCEAPGLSVTRMLTGLTSGDSSTELKLMAAYSAAEHSYGKAGRDIAAHHGQDVERTAVRRMALEVEQHAKAFAEQQRSEALERIEDEARQPGVQRLMLQGDGGSVRTGKLMDCEEGDDGYGQLTPKTNRPKRKRPVQNRELLTFDMRQPGQCEPSGLDVMVPVEAEPDERSRRMLALAARSGLGDNTQVIGLGDLGSNLPSSFDEAFVGYDAFYSGDWKHVRDYVEAAGAVLQPLDMETWKRDMLDAIWHRDSSKRDALLAQAHQQRMRNLPDDLDDKCPLHALEHYVCTNWHRMHAARLKAMGLDFVSARAEAQVRDRTKHRFCVPGAWRQQNIEGKATLRAIIAEGSWQRFRRYCLDRAMTDFQRQLRQRLDQAIAQGRLRVPSADNLAPDNAISNLPLQPYPIDEAA
jgi:hypothetical protein